MKIFKFKSLVILAVTVLFLAGCKDDTAPVVSPFVGNYVITNATMLAITPSISTNEIGTIPDALIAGKDISVAIQASLLSQVACDSADKSWIELREDKSIYMSCEGSNELYAGTWDDISATELKLNMNSAAIPSSPTGFALNVTEITIDGSNLSGKTSVPLPKEMIAAMVEQMGASLTLNSPVIFTVNFSIVFEKK